MGHSGLFLFNFVLFTPLFICKLKKHRCCVGIRTQGWRMVGADGSTELWLHAFKVFIYFVYKNKQRNKAASEIRFLALKNVWDQVPLHLSFSEIAICAFLRNVHCINLVNCFRKHLLNATKFCINWLNVGNVPTTNLTYPDVFLKMVHSRPLFSLFSSFQYAVDSKQMFNINKFLLMTGFETRISGIRSDRSTNWATQPLPFLSLIAVCMMYISESRLQHWTINEKKMIEALKTSLNWFERYLW